MKAISTPLLAPYLFDLQDRVHEKYKVTWSDAELAIRYLTAFFDAISRQPERIIILPQIADWAWHELILDTRRYRTFCSQVFGAFLSHVMEEVSNPKRNLRAEFAESLNFLQHTYRLGFGENPDEWIEAGWDRPAYRLRSSIDREIPLAPRSLDTGDLEDSWLYQRVASWLQHRLVRRFGISDSAARQGVIEHVEHLTALKHGNDMRRRSLLSEIAWEEHILWTQRYAEDCNDMLGYFLDHEPRSLAGSLVDLEPISAAHA